MKTISIACAAILALGANASPLERRQAPSSSAAPPPVPAPAGASASAPVAPVPSVLSGSALPSSAVSASAASASASAPSASASANPYAAYPCSSGNLTYVEVSQTYPGASLEAVLRYATFQNATYDGFLNGTGGEAVGATRTVTPGLNINITETLIAINTSHPGVAREFVYNLTAPIPLTYSNVSFYSYSTDFQVYTDVTAGNVTAAKLFTNACTTNSTGGIAFLTTYLNATLTGLGTVVSQAMASASAASSAAASSTASSSASAPVPPPVMSSMSASAPPPPAPSASASASVSAA